MATKPTRREQVVEREYRYKLAGRRWQDAVIEDIDPKHKIPSRPYSNTRSYARER